jgi:hypothetical protein
VFSGGSASDVDQALVVFYRVKRLKGGAIGLNVVNKQETIGTLASGTMFFRYVEPGIHTFSTQVFSQDSVTIEAEAGKIYLVEGISKIGLAVSRPELRKVEESEARAEISEH